MVTDSQAQTPRREFPSPQCHGGRDPRGWVSQQHPIPPAGTSAPCLPSPEPCPIPERRGPGRNCSPCSRLGLLLAVRVEKDARVRVARLDARLTSPFDVAIPESDVGTLIVDGPNKVRLPAPRLESWVAAAASVVDHEPGDPPRRVGEHHQICWLLPRRVLPVLSAPVPAVASPLAGSRSAAVLAGTFPQLLVLVVGRERLPRV